MPRFAASLGLANVSSLPTPTAALTGMLLEQGGFGWLCTGSAWLQFSLPSTAAGRALLNAADAAAQRTALGLGTAATSALSTTNAAALGTAAPGSETTVARADHVHPMPTAAQVGADPAGTGASEAAAAVNARIQAGTVNGRYARWNQTTSRWEEFDLLGTGNLWTSGQVFGGAAGVEGGQIELQSPVTGTNLTGSVAVDIYGDSFRVFGSFAGQIRGFMFDFGGAPGGIHIVWHTGNFDPNTKVSVSQGAASIGDPNTIGGTLSHVVTADPAGNGPHSFCTIWNFGTNGSRDGQLGWFYGPGTPQVWFRSRHDVTGTWNPWVQLYHSGNSAQVQAGTTTGRYARWNNTAARWEEFDLLGAANTWAGANAFITNDPSNSTIAGMAGSIAGLEAMARGTGAAAMTFHRPNAYAVHFGLDTDNQLKVGGWSMGSVSHVIWHAGNSAQVQAGTATGQFARWNQTTGRYEAFDLLGSANTWTGEQRFNFNRLTIGNQTFTQGRLEIIGANSGTNAGSLVALYLDDAKTIFPIAFGNRSAVLGGAIDHRPVIMSNTGPLDVHTPSGAAGLTVGGNLVWNAGNSAQVQAGTATNRAMVWNNTTGRVEQGSDIEDSRGNLRSVPVTVQNGAYTFTATDNGRKVMKDGATAITYTLPTGLASGTTIVVRNKNAAGNITISRSGTTLRIAGSGTNANATIAPWGEALLHHEGGEEWVISGTGVS